MKTTAANPPPVEPAPGGLRTSRISVVYSPDELEMIDAAAHSLHLTRSTFIRQSALLRAGRVLAQNNP